MRRAGALALVAGCVLLASAAAAQARPLPKRFFGIAPQTSLTAADTALMRSGRIGALRAAVDWSRVEPSPGERNLAGLEEAVGQAAMAGIEVMPFVYGTPGWLSPRPTDLPVANGEQRRAWTEFLREAVGRIGPGGSYWAEHPELPYVPVRRWQVWNEPNFHYFAAPVSPRRYAVLLRDSARAIKSADPGAQVLIGGLFGQPRGRPPRAMPAARFLAGLYRLGMRRFFDGVALHPYAAGIGRLAKIARDVRRVIVDNRDRRTGLYITEVGWGSEPNQRRVAFEVGMRGQARVLRNAYTYLIRARRNLNLKQVYWFTWKDAESDACSFCDSVGLFHGGDGFAAKPAWHAFKRVTRTPVRRFERGRRNRARQRSSRG